MDVKFKVWLENKGEVVLSNGKFGILKKIDQLGSIQKALGPTTKRAFFRTGKIIF
jgi:molybdenum-dependent DNA-binding transcriptional regulator ModE